MHLIKFEVISIDWYKILPVRKTKHSKQRMQIQNKMMTAVLVFIFTAALLIVNETMSLDTKIKIYKFAFCGDCPHQDLKEQLKQWDDKIEKFKQRHPDIDG